MNGDRIIDLVFSRSEPSPWRRTAFASLGAVAVYAIVTGVVLGSEHFLSEWSQMLAGHVSAALDRGHVIERIPPPPTPPPPPVKPAPSSPTREPDAPARRQAPRTAPAPPAFAQAGAIVARDPDPNEAVDLTGDAFVTGVGAVYSGGTTRSDGTSREPVHGPVQTRPPRPPRSPPPDRSRPVGLPSPAWSCPWPVEADNDSVNEVVAVIRVTVRPDGSVERATVLVDPGHGFGEAARRCALGSRFMPARDRSGRVVHADSPPIRVRFTR
jgi:protein TonB